MVTDMFLLPAPKWELHEQQHDIVNLFLVCSLHVGSAYVICTYIINVCSVMWLTYVSGPSLLCPLLLFSGSRLCSEDSDAFDIMNAIRCVIKEIIAK